MRTTKPISTISFNTTAFLALKLEELRNSGAISFWAFIAHKPEDDEGGKKEHHHVFIEPSKLIQTDDVKDFLKEFDPENPEHPKGCISFHSSKFDHWYLYALHDRLYLQSKGESRRFHYVHEEVITCDSEDLLYRSRMIDMLSISPYAAMMAAADSGMTFSEYFSRGTIPIQLIKQYQEAWSLLTARETNRNGRDGHENE